MQIRFSLRTFFILVTLLAVFCYIWLVRPTHVAHRFVEAVNSEDYKTADRLFVHVDHRFFADWADKRWAFQARCEVLPLTVSQLLTGRRQVDVQMSYFEFDHTAARQAQLTATPFGLGLPQLGSVQYESRIIDRARLFVPDVPRR